MKLPHRSYNQRVVALPAGAAGPGAYKVAWTPTSEGLHTLSMTLKGLHIKGSPFAIRARAGRNYSTIGTPKMEFGGEGEAEGQLCRPWGICCSKEGLILVANRYTLKTEQNRTADL